MKGPAFRTRNRKEDDTVANADSAREKDALHRTTAAEEEAAKHYVKRRVTENSADLIAENPIRAALWAAFAGLVIDRLSI